MDRNNDAMDALRYGLVDLLGYVRQPYETAYGDRGVVSTPESRGDYDFNPSHDNPYDPYGQGVHPSVVSTPETRGEVLVTW